MMINAKQLSRILGIAFLLQFITSFVSGLFLQPALIVPGDIGETMANIANNTWLMRTYILVDMLTAMGIIFLGVMLFLALRKQNETMSLVALGLYVLEATLLAGSRLAAFWLLRISEEYVAEGQPAYSPTLGNLALESMDFVGVLLHVLVFSLGAIIFYFLFYQSRLIPRALSLWGLITLIPILYGTVAAIFGYEISAVAYFPYLPFEFVVGIWILVKGLSVEQEDRLALKPA
jgi:hypothetical protein